MVLFVDTGYWIAILDKEDALHQKASGFSGVLKTSRIYTSEMVLTEVLNHFSKAGSTSRQVAVHLVQKLQKTSNVTIIPQSSEAFSAALTRYEAMRDKEWGLTDCASFIIMAEMGLTKALAYDRHFMQAGFQALLRED